MKNWNIRYKIVVVMAMMLVVSGVVAQTLNEIKDSAQKALDKTAKTIVDGAVDTAKGVFTDPNNPNNKGGIPDNLGTYETDGRKIEQVEVEDNSQKEPFRLGSGTRYVTSENTSVTSTAVSQGIFGVNDNGAYQFYKIDGTSFTNGKWRTNNSYREPLVTLEGIFMYKDEGGWGSNLYHISYYGIEKAMPEGVREATNFVDGLAIAMVDGKWQYLDKDCRVVHANVHPLVARIDGRNGDPAPLKEGRRAFKSADNYKWGYIDEKGVVVIAPQYEEVRSFSDGLALVKDSSGRRYFIDRDGKKAYDPSWPATAQGISDYDSGICAVNLGTSLSGSGDEWDVNSAAAYTAYYSKTGTHLGTVTYGSAFHNGVAYCRVKTNEPLPGSIGEYVEETRRLSTAIKPMGVVDKLDFFHPEIGESSRSNVPYYDAMGVAHISKRNTIGLHANPEYFGDYELGEYSADGYALAEMRTAGGSTYYKGIVDGSGTFVIIYSVQKSEDSLLPLLPDL